MALRCSRYAHGAKCRISWPRHSSCLSNVMARLGSSLGSYYPRASLEASEFRVLLRVSQDCATKRQARSTRTRLQIWCGDRGGVQQPRVASSPIKSWDSTVTATVKYLSTAAGFIPWTLPSPDL